MGRRCSCRLKVNLIIICLLVALLLWLHFSLIPSVTSSYNKDCYMSEDFRKSLTFMLISIITAFEKHNVQYWLDYGTLLGAIRHNGGLIPWDGDGDISYMKDDPNIKNAFMDIRHKSIHINTMVAQYKGVSVDLMRWYSNQSSDGRIYFYKYYPPWSRDNFVTRINHKLEAFPIEWIGQRKKITFLGVQASIPQESKSFLKHRYRLSYGFNIQYRWKCYVPCWLSHADSSCRKSKSSY